MLENCSKDLLERFNSIYNARLLDYRIKEDGIFLNETIYYEVFNVLGTIKKTTIKENGYNWIGDNSMIAGDLQILIDKSRWFYR